MSFLTSLTGINAATQQLGVTSNNIANVSTVGFKRSRTDFGDIFATSPLQKASSTIGQGVALKRVTQVFGQGNLSFSSNTLDLAISGDGFFPLKSQDGFQDIFTRNGSFMMNSQNNVVNSAGQLLEAASVDSSGKANLSDMNVLTIPQQTTGMAKQTSQISLGLNFPADAAVITAPFNRNDPTTYNESTALTVYDAGGNSYLATVYYAKTQNASQADPTNKWQTYVYVGDTLVNASLQQATNSTGSLMYVNKYGQMKAASDFTTPADIAALNGSFSQKTEKFSLDNLKNVQTSQPATVTGGQATGLGTGVSDGIDFSNYTSLSKSDLNLLQGGQAKTYTLPTAVLPTDNYQITVGNSTININGDGTKAPTMQQVVDGLNSNSTFAASFVATVENNNLKVTELSAATMADPAGNNFDSIAITSNIGTTTSTLTTKGVAATQVSTVTFSDLAQGDTVSVGGLTLTALSAMPASAVATAFANLKDGVTPAGLANTYSFAGSLSGYGSESVATAGKAVNFYSTTPDTTETEVAVGATSLSSTIPTPTITTVMGAALPTGIVNSSPSLVFDPNNINATPGADKNSISSLDGLAFTFADPANPTSNITVKGAPQVDATTGVTTGALQNLVDSLNGNSSFKASYFAQIDPNGSLRIGVKAGSTSAYSNMSMTTVPPSGNETSQSITGQQIVASSGANLYSNLKSVDDLKNLFSINADGSNISPSIGLDRLAGLKNPDGTDMVLSGAQVASELTNEIARAYGGQKLFDFSSLHGTGSTFTVKLSESPNSTLKTLNVDLSQAGQMSTEQLVKEVQSQINEQADSNHGITVSYDTSAQKLVFTPAQSLDRATISSTQSVIGLSADLVQGVNDPSVSLGLAPSSSTSPLIGANDQRYGTTVTYDEVKQSFVFASGTTGDTSSISVTNIKPNSLATSNGVTTADHGLGLTGDPASYVAATSPINAVRGLVSTPAVLTGNAMAVNVSSNFSVDSTNNQFVISVNGVTGTVTIPPKDNYTIGTFTQALQDGINALQGPTTNGLTPQSVNGVKVTYDSTKNSLVFTTGTANNSTYIKVSGDAHWGLDSLNAQFGATSTWIKPTPDVDSKGSTVYIDGFGAETTSASGFNTLPQWSPIYLNKGELTFNTTGNLVSPTQGSKLDTVYLPNGKGALSININYSKSTQYASPYSVLSQSQDGAPEGDLVGLAIADDGLVTASYSNGSQKSLAKIVLANFSNPSGLRQIGDTSYYKSSDSGAPKYGEAGSAGYGTVRSGATENANVDLTQELVDLITEQRNFQANSKALETDNTLTTTIIQIRS